MANFDTTWMAFGLFLLGCGGVPALAALLAERRRGRAWGSRDIEVSREDAHATGPGTLGCARSLPALLTWATSFGPHASPR